MQKNETAAIEKSGEEQLNTAAESPEKEISAEAKPDKTNPVSADSSEKEPLKTADKISAVKSVSDGTGRRGRRGLFACGLSD